MDTKNIMNTSEKKSARKQVMDELLLDLEATILYEKKLKDAIEGLQATCKHEKKEYQGATPNGSKIFDCMECKKRFYE